MELKLTKLETIKLNIVLALVLNECDFTDDKFGLTPSTISTIRRINKKIKREVA